MAMYDIESVWKKTDEHVQYWPVMQKRPMAMYSTGGGDWTLPNQLFYRAARATSGYYLVN